MPLGYAETVSDHKSVLEKQGGQSRLHQITAHFHCSQNVKVLFVKLHCNWFHLQVVRVTTITKLKPQLCATTVRAYRAPM